MICCQKIYLKSFWKRNKKIHVIFTVRIILKKVINLIGRKVIIKYILLQIPELILLVIALIICSKFINIQTWLVITIIIIWIVKDIILFPKTWRSYDTTSKTPLEKLIGMNGIVMDSLNPVGYVRVKGELWKAETTDPEFPAKKGDEITVIDVKGMQLIVKVVDNS